MENEQLPVINFSEQDAPEQKKEKSRRRIFGILVGLIVLFAVIAIFEFVWLITH